MVTVIVTNGAGHRYEHESLTVTKPAEVVGSVLAQASGSSLCVALDLNRMGLSAEAAVDWVREFHRIFLPLARAEGRAGRPPSLAVFTDAMAPADRKALREVGAVLFVRSSLADGEARTSDALLQQLAALDQPADFARAAPAQRSLEEADLAVVNGYPLGMTAGWLDKVIAGLNAQDD